MQDGTGVFTVWFVVHATGVLPAMGTDGFAVILGDFESPVRLSAGGEEGNDDGGGGELHSE